jgi:serine O-acetyltransferase
MVKERYLIHDLNRYFYPNNRINRIGWIRKIRIIVMTQGIWALIVYRMGAWCVRKKKGTNALWLKPISMWLTVMQKIIEITTGISLPPKARIGRGFYIGHYGGIIIGHEVKIGRYCNISQGVTIGQAGRGEKQLSPVIGDRVFIGAGAIIFGGIVIGNDVAIGANAVVNRDLPDNTVAAGVPAKIVNYNSSRHFVLYNENR